MTVYSNFNVIYRLQKWLDSVPGQTFMNYAYSWGASIVILGTLFKLTHLPGANFMLFLGMGTEVIVFFISAFDRPFDKTADGKDLPTHVTKEEIEEGYKEDMEAREAAENADSQPFSTQPAMVQPAAMAGVNGGGTIIIGGGMPAGAAAAQPTPSSEADGEGQDAATVAGAAAMAASQTVNMQQWVAQQAQVSPEMAEATTNYVESLNNLTEIIQKVSEQSMHLTRDSEEMENLNRTLTGICKIYEMQLKAASAQIGTGDQINDKLQKMAQQIEQLNAIYARMIEAMTVNMRVAAPGTPQQ